jgi:hypothetical protein
MHLDARQEMILVFTAGALFLGVLILYVAIRIKAHIARVSERVEDIHSIATEGVPAAEASLIREDIKGMRTHMVSNHDETDGELRRIAESTDAIAREAKRANILEFEKQVASQLEAIRADQSRREAKEGKA